MRHLVETVPVQVDKLGTYIISSQYNNRNKDAVLEVNGDQHGLATFLAGLQLLMEQIKLIANILFVGAIIWAAIRTVISFAGGSPTAMRNVLYTIIIALFWFGFNYFVEDIASSLGGVGAGQYGGQ